MSFAATMRPDGAVGSRDDVTARDMHGMILDDAAGGHDKSPGETVADSESRALLKTVRGFGVQQKYSNVPRQSAPGTHRQHTDLAGTAAKRPAAPLVGIEEADRVMTDRDQLKITFDSGGTAVLTGTA